MICMLLVTMIGNIMMEVIRREKEKGIVPSPEVDTYMKATSVKGQKRTLQTDYVLKPLDIGTRCMR